MPAYHHLATLVPHSPASALTSLYRQVSRNVISAGGVVRSVENMGVRPLPYRFKNPHPPADLDELVPGALSPRYHENGRFVVMCLCQRGRGKIVWVIQS